MTTTDPSGRIERGLLPPGFGSPVVVFGPAYLDRTYRVRGPLARSGQPPADHSVTVRSISTGTDPDMALRVRSPGGDELQVRSREHPAARNITVLEPRLFGSEGRPHLSTVDLVAYSEVLGGMAAGYARALPGRLITPIGEGPEADRIHSLLSGSSLLYNAVVVPGTLPDTTELVLNRLGEKLAVGRRGASLHVTADTLVTETDSAGLTVVCSLPPAVAGGLMAAAGGCTVFAPSLRYVQEESFPDALARADITVLNDREWRTARCPVDALGHNAILAVTHGAAGARITWQRNGRRERARIPALDKDSVADPNRAGEAFAAGLVGALVACGVIRRGRCRPADRATIVEAGWQACLAAWLELDITKPTFPTRAEVLALQREHPRPEQ